MECTGAEGHPLNGCRQGSEGTADVAFVPEGPFEHIGDSFDILMSVERPDGSRNEHVVVEYTQSAEAVVLWITVTTKLLPPTYVSQPGAVAALAKIADDVHGDAVIPLRAGVAQKGLLTQNHNEVPQRALGNVTKWATEERGLATEARSVPEQVGNRNFPDPALVDEALLECRRFLPLLRP